MKKLSYVWLVVRSLLFILVLIGAFTIASTGFETIVVAGLVIIYLSILGFSSAWGLTQLEFIGQFAQLRLSLSKVLKEEVSEEETAEAEEALKEFNRKKDETTIKALINSVFVYIAYLIAVLALLGTLLA